MSYQNILVETKGRVGIIRLNRPQALNALNRALIGRTHPGDRRLRGRRQDRLHADHRQRQGFRRRRRHQGDGRQDLHRGLSRQFRRRLGPRHARAQADCGGGRGLCARRRLRARHALRHHHRRRQRQIRPARDQARRHPRHRRHAAAHARGRQGQGDGHDPDRPHDGRRARPSAPGWWRAWCRRRT